MKTLETHFGCQHYVIRALMAKVERQESQYHKPHEEELLLHQYSPGQGSLSPHHQELDDEEIMTQGISGQKDSHPVQLKKKKVYEEML